MLFAALTSIGAFACGTSSTPTSTSGGPALPGPGATDGGAQPGARAWSQAGLDNDIIDTVAVDPKRPSTIYLSLSAGSADKGFRRSKDGGQTWTKLAGGLPDTFAGAIAASTCPATTATRGRRRGLLPTAGGAMLDIAATASRPGVLFVQTASAGIFRSTDGAASFTKLDTGANPTRYAALRIDPKNPTTLYVSADDASGSSGGLLESTDDGQSWSSIGPNGLAVTAVDITPDGTLFAGTIGKGIWRFGTETANQNASPQ